MVSRQRAIAVSTIMVAMLLGFNLIKNSYLLGAGPPIDSSSVNMMMEGLFRNARQKQQQQQQQQQHDSYEENATHVVPTRPKLSSLVEGNHVTGNVDFLLHFAIVGHAKTASSLFQGWLRSHPYIRMDRWEWHALTTHQPAEMVRLLYNLSDTGLRGYKAPRDIVDPVVLDLLSEHWPSTKLIVGLRHPIPWFQSLYNFKAKRYNDTPNALQLIGECMQDMDPSERAIHQAKVGSFDRGVCTDLARYHVHLSLLGKTNVTEPRQDRLLGPRRVTMASRAPLHHPVFLYEAEQLSDSNEGRFRQFKFDLEQYLGLPEPLGLPPGSDSDEANSNPHKHFPLDICRPKYNRLRAELLRHGAAASTWILDYFLDLPSVHVSSPEYFRTLLQSWHVDPCLAQAAGEDSRERRLLDLATAAPKRRRLPSR